MQAELRSDDDDGAARVVDALAEEVLAEPPLLALEHVGQRFERPLVRAAQHPAAAPISDELAKAAGVPTVPTRIVVMPDDDSLGEFRKVLAERNAELAALARNHQERLGQSAAALESLSQDVRRGAAEADGLVEATAEIEKLAQDQPELLPLVERMLDQARSAFSHHQEQASRDALLSRLTTREAQVLERIVAGPAAARRAPTGVPFAP